MQCLQLVFLEFHSHGDREKEKKAKMKHRHEFMGLLRKYVPSRRLGDADTGMAAGLLALVQTELWIFKISLTTSTIGKDFMEQAATHKFSGRSGL